MSTHTNTNKSLYIARPKKTDSISSSEAEVIHANKLSGKPYIAYPKNGNYSTNIISEAIELQEILKQVQNDVIFLTAEKRGVFRGVHRAPLYLSGDKQSRHADACQHLLYHTFD